MLCIVIIWEFLSGKRDDGEDHDDDDGPVTIASDNVARRFMKSSWSRCCCCDDCHADNMFFLSRSKPVNRAMKLRLQWKKNKIF